MLVEEIAADSQSYEQWLDGCPGALVWQSPAWQKLQTALSRQVRLFVVTENNTVIASALCIIDRTSIGLSTWDIPRGPLAEDHDIDSQALTMLIEHIIAQARKDGAIEITLSPVHPLLITNGKNAGFKPTARHVHPEATLIVDLTQSEDAILAQMHQKGRYNIKVAERHGIKIREGTSHDISAFYGLLQETSGRDGFGIHSQHHYEQFLVSLPGAFLLLAEHGDKVVAGLLGVVWKNTGIYYYGASSYEDRAFMAPYLLQWQAMLRCKALGCTAYDLLGISPVSTQEQRSEDPWEGITAFKEKFGGTTITYPAEQGIVFRPMLKKLLAWKRKIWR